MVRERIGGREPQTQPVPGENGVLQAPTAHAKPWRGEMRRVECGRWAVDGQLIAGDGQRHQIVEMMHAALRGQLSQPVGVGSEITAKKTRPGK